MSNSGSGLLAQDGNKVARSSQKPQEGSELHVDGKLMLGVGIWFTCCSCAFIVWMACILPAGTKGSCSARLLNTMLYVGLLVLVSIIAVPCGYYILQCVFEGCIACIRHKYFAKLEEWLAQNDPTWTWPSNLRLLRQRLPELRKDSTYVAAKRRNLRRAAILLVALAIFTGMSTVYTHFHYLKATVLKPWLYFSVPDDPYTLLGVHRNASFKEIRHAYRRMSLRCHPEKEYEVVFQSDCLLFFDRGWKAWTILSNDTLKAAWDGLPKKSFDRFLHP